ncbi:MAG: thioredoxin family protein [Candidatus Eisenbacteria bacterium]|nr:thioredoxin family protein [Candidatus Eisenbacteria bacterium]
MNRTARIAIFAVVVAAVISFAIARESGRRGTGGSSASTRAGIPRLVDLGSTTCIPCKMMAPILEELEKEYEGRLIVEVIDVKTDRNASARYAVRVIPTQIFFDSTGRELFRHEGFYSKEDILAKYKELGIDLGTGSTGKKS